MRHHLVQRIVRAYDEHKARVAEQQMLLLAEPRNAEPAAANEKVPSIVPVAPKASEAAG